MSSYQNEVVNQILLLCSWLVKRRYKKHNLQVNNQMEVGPSSSVFLKHGEFNYLKDWHDQTEFNNKRKTVATMVG